MAIDIRTPQTQKIVLGGIAGAALLYGWFFTELLPFTHKANAAEIGVLETRYRDLSKDLTKARQAVHQLPYLEKESELLHRKWEQGRRMLPEMVEMTSLLRVITLVGTQSGIEFTKFKPLPPVRGTNYFGNPVEIGVVGGYHQVGAFLAEIANLDRVISVRDLELETNKDKDRGEDSAATNPAAASFVAIAYTMPKVMPPPPPPPPEKGGKKTVAKKTDAKKADAKSEAAKTKGRPTTKSEGASDE